MSNRNKNAGNAIENNPCGICRGLGLPFCKGHGDGAKVEVEAEDTPKANSVKPDVTEIRKATDSADNTPNSKPLEKPSLLKPHLDSALNFDSEADLDADSYKSPSPFDISSGPKLSGG